MTARHRPSLSLAAWAALALMFPTDPSAAATTAPPGARVNPGDHPSRLSIMPPAAVLTGADSAQQLAVTAHFPGATDQDVTARVEYSSNDPKVARVLSRGQVVPTGDGACAIQARLGDRVATARVRVKGFHVDAPVNFTNQVEPILSKFGCNAGGCHGKQQGQNGFKLSLLGFDPQFDYAALTQEGRGRRVFPADPEASLMLRKPTLKLPHGGGRRFEAGSDASKLLRRWIAEGMPFGSAGDRRLVKVRVWPEHRIMGRHAEQQMLVTAAYSDGSTEDVTRNAEYKSNVPSIARVDDEGRVQTLDLSGETAIMARYQGLVAVFRATVPLGKPIAHYPELVENNFVDHHVFAKLRQLGIIPSGLCTDEEFIRRVTLDICGTLPTADEVRAFLADSSPARRSRLIDRLLERPEYADFFAVTWGDILRNKRRGGQENMRGTFAFHAWIRDSIAANKPYDRFVREIVAATGDVSSNPPVIWYREVRNLDHQVGDTAELFLGLRIQCARCHHHPYEKWSQDDYYSLAAFFARLGQKPGEIAQENRIFVRRDGEVQNPQSGKTMKPRGLDGPELTIPPGEDPRQRLIDWMARPDNPFFARAVANRYWAHFLGRGIVDPIDDMRITNPPSNPQLLDALARDLVAHKFDLKHLIRVITKSRTYQLSAQPNEYNVNDRQNYARAYPKRLPAEVLLDAVCQVTGTREDFGGLPQGTRAIQLPDEGVGSEFLDTFGRPQRETPCECERSQGCNLAQVLTLLNSNDLQGRISSGEGRVARLAKNPRPDAAKVEELYLWAYARRPRPRETALALKYIGAATDKKQALEDLLWAMLNSREFVFNH